MYIGHADFTKVWHQVSYCMVSLDYLYMCIDMYYVYVYIICVYMYTFAYI